MVLWLLPLNRLLGRFIPAPLPAAGTFDNKTVLVTGGTSGLGMAAAKHFVSLGAHVIITCRAIPRGENAKKAIEAATAGSKGRVSLMELDMTSYGSCVKLVDDLKKEFSGKGGIDVAVLNAGCLEVEFIASPEGWEKTLQVNTLSTVLLGLLFVEWMKEERQVREDPSHIVVVNSRDHLYADTQHWATYAEEGGIMQHFNKEENWSWSLGGRPNYAESKLFMTYALEELTELARGPDGEPQVLVNSLCPGCVRTDIGRVGYARSWVMKVGTILFFAVGGKTADSGARFYVKVATLPKEEHGKFCQAWLSHDKYLKLAKTVRNVTCPNSRNLQKLVWGEISSELAKNVPTVGMMLAANANSKQV